MIPVPWVPVNLANVAYLWDNDGKEGWNMDRLQEIIRRGRRIVFFGGAGVSTASGISDLNEVIRK